MQAGVQFATGHRLRVSSIARAALTTIFILVFLTGAGVSGSRENLHKEGFDWGPAVPIQTTGFHAGRHSYAVRSTSREVRRSYTKIGHRPFGIWHFDASKAPTKWSLPQYPHNSMCCTIHSVTRIACQGSASQYCSDPGARGGVSLGQVRGS
jgi:hypothetical protein